MNTKQHVKADGGEKDNMKTEERAKRGVEADEGSNRNGKTAKGAVKYVKTAATHILPSKILTQ